MTESSLHKMLPPVIVGLLVIAMFAVSGWQAYPFVNKAFLHKGSYLSTLLGVQLIQEKNAPIRSVKQIAPAQKQRNIAALSLFGQPVLQQAPKKEQQAVNLPKTNLKLTLRGVLASDGSDASALIEGPDRDTENYRIDDTLPGNAVLKSVHNDRVVISRNGRLENLFFPKIDSSKIESYVPPAAVSYAPAANQQSANADLNSQMGIPQSISTLRQKQKQKLQDRLKKLREKLMQNR